jgi:5-formyltetrahydrofolate cyclo-ligase
MTNIAGTDSPKARLREQAFARRDALPADARAAAAEAIAARPFPATERDARLDFVLTEREVIDLRETR